MEQAQILLVAFLVAFTLVAAVIDVRTRKLPNWLTIPALAAALAFHGWTGGWVGFADSMLGFAVGFSILLVLWLVGGGGGGDVKLMGAVGGWLGWKMTLAVFVLSTIFAVLGSILVMILTATRRGVQYVRRRHWRARDRQQPHFANEASRQEQLKKRRLLPYALPVALSVWLVLAYQVIVKH